MHGEDYCNSYGAGVGSGIEAPKLTKRIKEWTEQTLKRGLFVGEFSEHCLLYTSPSPRDP